MDLSLREAATLLGRNPRTLRAQLARGEITATKQGGRWSIPRHSLPLTEAQRQTLEQRAEEARQALQEALPSRLAPTRQAKRRSVADMETFRGAQALLQEMGKSAPAADLNLVAARAELERGLLKLCEGNHAFDAGEKLRAFLRARQSFSRAVGRLLLDQEYPLPEPRLHWLARLEGEVLPALSGLIRWAERLGRKAPC